MCHLCMTHEPLVRARPHAAMAMLPAASSRMSRHLMTAPWQADGTRRLSTACDKRPKMQGRRCNRSCSVFATYMHFCHAILALLLLFHDALEDLQSIRFSHCAPGPLDGQCQSITSPVHAHLYSVWSKHCLPIVCTVILLLPVSHASCKKFNQRSVRSPSPNQA